MFEKFEVKKANEKISETIDTYKKKIEASILPPDPARTVEFVLRVPIKVEHILPIPPILEKIHSEITSKLVESLPRLPLTSDYPKIKWLEWEKE